MRISVIVITYNWPQALDAVLQGLERQRELPFEVIVTDDGSSEETRKVLARHARTFPVRLTHIWQPDDGARMSRARNRGILAARGDYIVLLDGDMVPSAHFIADHRAFAQRGCFVQGSRMLPNEQATRRMFANGRFQPHFFTRGLQRRRHSLRLLWLARAWAQPRTTRRGIKSCNMGFWREDLIAINGFNEAMTGWGREDAELAVRAFNYGLMRRDMRFAGMATHLWHRSRKYEGRSINDEILDVAVARGLQRCEHGIDAHLGEFAQPPEDLRADVAA
ncbi:glycosyltransferase family 2 protein [Oleiagrimonas soli]|uniref:Glycosyl transferase family 2 n=1 Tax=Oleiagrimonas soli TaxID=1543381 RepID=A0A099CUT1_9GAMM|nr:glycosyltransferase family 2 protein [Oleiagrimonas soli]KGI76775.1 glycosyl transferase family 2 [Oleiagrimonas soli]MBB6184983.1 glycosyltransferase involved in cell wall biosynthesis [Oleiagrimonas soli]